MEKTNSNLTQMNHDTSCMVPIRKTDISSFDEALTYMKDKFMNEMRIMDEEMDKFSTQLKNYYGNSSKSTEVWDTVPNSPLVQGEGADRALKLQFDLSQFHPSEITVQVTDNVLNVAAVHQEKNDSTQVYREFKKSFVLPKGTKAETVASSFSPDGVLTVEAPLPPTVIALDNKSMKSRDSRQSSKKKK